ncbi:hypothetical protein [Pseudomonas sp.]|uniref:hypothetical protein n=1 Tax=Pseudomonas sp. TaxID=306 RepID=UPI003C446FEC
MQIPLSPGHVVGGARHDYQGEQRRQEDKKNGIASNVNAFTQPRSGLAYGGKMIAQRVDLNRASPGDQTLTKNLEQLLVLGSGLLESTGRLLKALAAYLASPSAPSPSQPSSVATAPVKPAKSHGKAAVSERPVPEKTDDVELKPVKGAGKKPGTGNEAGNIWTGFKQGPDGNCATVSAIKAAMMRFGMSPRDIYKKVEPTGDGYNVEMRDGYKLHLTKDEFRQAAEGAQFKGNDPTMLEEAKFLFAVSAKRAYEKNNDNYAGRSFGHAIQSLNDSEWSLEALQRLGLGRHIRETTADELARGQLGVVEHDVVTPWSAGAHSMAVIGGREEIWGRKGAPPPTGATAFALD